MNVNVKRKRPVIKSKIDNNKKKSSKFLNYKHKKNLIISYFIVKRENQTPCSD